MKWNNIFGRNTFQVATGITIVSVALLVILAGGAEAATPIDLCTIISSPGEYVLIRDIIDSGAPTCVYIISNDVIFNGAGHSIDGVDADNTYGVYIYSNDLNKPRTNVTVKNLKVMDWYYGIYYDKANGIIYNNNASSNKFIGIMMRDSSGSVITSNNVNSNNKGIYLLASNKNTIANNIASSNENGIDLSISSDNTFINNTAISNLRSGMYLYFSSSIGYTNNTLINNRMANNKYNFGLYGDQDSHFNNNIDSTNTVDGRHIRYIKNSKNIVYDNSTDVGTFYCISCNNITIRGLNLNKNRNGIFFWNTNNSKIENINASSNENGIFIGSSSNNTLTGNTVSSNFKGILLQSSSNNILARNTPYSNFNDGIFLQFSSNNTLTDNIIRMNYRGIYIVDSSNNNTINNNIAGSNSLGIGISYSSNNNILIDNNASNNDYEGLLLRSSSYNTLRDNTANSNRVYGLYLESTGNNSIYNNYFNNSNNIGFIGPIYSGWNITRTAGINIVGGPYLGGNFWANPDGSGFSQTCSDSDNDGICDSPYLLDGSNIDYLPLSNKPAYNGISSCIDISSPGTYVLTADLSNSSTCINITSSDVILDGAGHTINGTVAWGSSGVYVYDAAKLLMNITVKNLKVTNWTDGIYYQNIQNGSIINNIANSNVRDGISLVSSRNSRLSGNTATFSNRYGVYLYYTSNSTITGNKINSYYGDGIRLDYSSNNTLADNKANSNNNWGVLLDHSTSNLLKSNNALNNGHGFLLDNSYDNTLSFNNVSNNEYDGMHLSSSGNNTLSDNTASHNKRSGFNLSDSSNNKIYNNYFNNTNNALDSRNNIWNMTRTNGTNIIGGPFIGGNYWSDYAGKDIDGDGLGDTLLPYNSSGGIKTGGDMHTLVYSMNGSPPVADCGSHKLRCENVGSPVQFDGSASYDPDGYITSYDWDFGDGTNGTGVTPKHAYSTYRWNGTAYQPFIVNLTVIDNNGLTNSTSQKVVIWITGDATGDGKVNILDASVVGLKWGTNDPCADLNNDGKVNILDASIIGLNWNKKAEKNA